MKASNPFQIQANLAVLWSFMEEHEGIDLGGITALCDS